jgi:diguanylate cyclase (GGDEF)-like protein
LTGLNNRRAFIGSVGKWLDEGHSKGGALLILDLDHFKRINDTYGHQAGDKALKVFADFLLSFSQRNAISGRVGGEEFAIFVGGLTGSAADRLASEICRAASLLKVEHGGQMINLTVSIGLTDTRMTNPEFEKLYAEADMALYRAKKTGRNRARRFAPSLRAAERPLAFESKVKLRA